MAPSTGFAHAGGSALVALGVADGGVCVPVNFCSSRLLPRFRGGVRNEMEERAMLGWGELFALGIILHF